MKGQNEEIAEILNSLDGMRPAEANPFLYEKIKFRMSSAKISKSTTVKWAFALSLIILLNILSWRSFTNDQNQGASSLAGELGITGSTYRY